MLSRLTIFIPCCLFVICAQAQNQPLFKLLSPKETGIDFKNHIQETEALNVLSYEYFYNGGGVAAGDINNDGLIDLYFTANMKPDKLYLNLGNLKFKDITKQARISSRSQWKTGVSMADVNGDGHLDIYVCYSGSGDTESRRNQLYINNGDLTFKENAKSFGLDDPAYSTQAAFVDYDRDGDLDMYLLNHSIKDYKDVELTYLKKEYDSLAGDKLYKNDNGKFRDVSREAGISGNPISFGLGISVSDVNSDGWPDLYISNDYRENDYLYINNGDGTFSDKIFECLQHLSEFSMGNDIADINNDALPDIITLDMLPEDNRRQKLLQGPENYELYRAQVKNGFHHQFMRNMLQLNNGDGTFSEIGQLAGISNTDWSWTPLLADFDNDGFKDLFISNGYLRDYTNKDFLKYWGNYVVQKAMKMEKTALMDLVTQMPSTLTPNYIFSNNGQLQFTNSTTAWGLGQLVLTGGAVYADLDNDGDLDLVLNNVNENAFVYRNDADRITKANYVDIKLTGAGKNVFAIGAVVNVYYNGNVQRAEQSPARGYQSCVPPVLHFGLGSQAVVDSVSIRWPDGKMQTVRSVKTNQVLEVRQNGADESISRPSTSPWFQLRDDALDFFHKDYDYNDFKRQPLMPFMLSHVGPVLAKGDVNGDGSEDLFIGASKGQGSKLFLQVNGAWQEKYNAAFDEDKFYTASDAIFFDTDKDGDLDLYVVSGGYHDYDEGNALLADRLYLNDGKGNYTKSKTLPSMLTSKSCVKVHDFDRDGDADLFVGGRVVPGRYPEAPASYLLQNDGSGNFSDVTDQIAPGLRRAGMVTDAAWCDLDGDSRAELVVAGEWMPVTVFAGERTFTDQTSKFFNAPASGFWNTIAAGDHDGDGDVDLVVGNLGLNTQIKASDAEPAEMIYKDFDANGSVDPFLCYYIQGKPYQYVTRDELLDQIYPMRKKFTSYQSYADTQLKDIFSEADISSAKKLKANTLETTFFENENGKLVPKKLPLQVQYSPVQSIQVADVNQDGIKDMLFFGNHNYPRLKLGKLDANFGVLLKGKGKGEFEYVTQTGSGLKVVGDVKDSILLNTKDGHMLVIGINMGPLMVFKIKSNAHGQ